MAENFQQQENRGMIERLNKRNVGNQSELKFRPKSRSTLDTTKMARTIRDIFRDDDSTESDFEKGSNYV